MTRKILNTRVLLNIFILSVAITSSLFSGTTFAQTIQGPASAGPSTAPPQQVSVSGLAKSATIDQFTNAEKLAAGAVLTGIKGGCGGSQGVGNKAVGCADLIVNQSFAFGSSTAPYTTARVAVTTLGISSTSAVNVPVTSYPNRATGRLYFKIGTANYVCTASLIKPGVLVTAAHCVYEYGLNTAAGWHTNFTWCPANTSATTGPYGCYGASSPRIANSYYNGTDTCTQRGVVCNNDIATLLVSPTAGSTVGWYAYGWNGYSYAVSSFLGNATTVQLTQLGYPVGLDNGYQMERTDAVGWYFASGNLKNTQLGSAQTGGSSGGPWLTNFGTTPVVTNTATTSLGSSALSNVVVGVTSYGSTTVGYNRQGSSYFGQNVEFPLAAYGTYGAGNIGKLMQDTCTASPTYC